jgi:hypothetical protein
VAACPAEGCGRTLKVKNTNFNQMCSHKIVENRKG